ncbi:hypothetical protein FRC04_001446 [Tulasnella sp. 424]|nr:hypothetical protein FRC04_001446 [Tulasnella sp. 424]KAG8972720.1 hypothetical protein FRC05_009641 [Tulasnella sp. 425]
MIVSWLFLTALAAASLVFAAPASRDNELQGVSRWTLEDSQSVPRAVPQIFDTGRSELKSSKRETNAERLARGLPPLKPRKLFGSGTKVDAALKPRTSIVPKNTILLYDTQGRSGTLLGYWSIGYTTTGVYQGCYYLTTSCSDSITNPLWHSNDRLDNPAAPANYPEIGGTTRSNKDVSWDTSTGNYNVAFVNGVLGYGQGISPQQSPNHSYQNGWVVNNNQPGADPLQVESNIWDCSSVSGECLPYWITPSGDRKSAYLVYIPDRQNVLLLTSDVSKLRNEGSFEDAIQVRMFLENNYVCPI